MNKIPGRQDFPLLPWLGLELGCVGGFLVVAMIVINSGLLFYSCSNWGGGVWPGTKEGRNFQYLRQCYPI